jgi:transposase
MTIIYSDEHSTTVQEANHGTPQKTLACRKPSKNPRRGGTPGQAIVPKDRVAHRILAKQRLKMVLEVEAGASCWAVGKKYGYSKTQINIWHRRWINAGKKFSALLNHKAGPRRPFARYDIDQPVAELFKKGFRGPRLQLELKKRGITASLPVIYRSLKRQNLTAPKRRKPKKQKPVPRTFTLGYLQMDTIHIGRGGPYQYSAVCAVSRVAFCRVYPDLSVNNSMHFLFLCYKFFPFTITTVHTDGGTEFTFIALAIPNTNHWFTRALDAAQKAHEISVGKPWRNGRVERYHRTIQDEFYRLHTDPSVLSYRAQMPGYLQRYNERREHQGLGWRMPKQVLEDVLGKAIALDYHLAG